MSTNKKPRADSPLKTLPEDRQAVIADYARTHTLTETRQWLAQDGFKTSEAALSLWLSWHRRQHALQESNNLVEQFEEFTRTQNPDWTPDKVRDTAISFFLAHTANQQDPEQFATIVKLDQQERFGRTKASQKERELKIAEARFLLESDALLERLLDKAKELLANTGLSQADRIAEMRKAAFKDVEELEKSGQLVIPK